MTADDHRSAAAAAKSGLQSEEPILTDVDWRDVREGAALFNTGQFWHAHEAWEAVWRRHRTHKSHVFFKGLIQLAAAHHQREHGRYRGMLVHFARVREKLTPFAPEFLGMAITPLLASVAAGEREARSLGRERLKEFNRELVPTIDLRG